MKNSPIIIKKSELDGRAEDYFLKGSGLLGNDEKTKRMREAAEIIKREVQEGKSIEALLCYFDYFKMHEEKLILEGAEFSCNAFSFMKEKQVKAIYLYVITAGESDFADRGIMDQLYAHLWETAYLDGARGMLKEWILKDYFTRDSYKADGQEVKVSDSFGPGFYGMDSGEVKKMLSLMEAEKIGVACNESGFMCPLKSCAGIYFVVEKNTSLPELKCESCLGNLDGCKICNVRTSL